MKGAEATVKDQLEGGHGAMKEAQGNSYGTTKRGCRARKRAERTVKDLLEGGPRAMKEA